MRLTCFFLISAALACGGEVLVDNITGAIRVTGYDGNTVEAVIEKRVTADSPALAEEANRDVRLDMGPAGGAVRFYVDGPFRSKESHGRRGYNVAYDFDLKVPRATRLKLKTVNGGVIAVTEVAGDYDVSNVNGGIEMHEVSGAGSARTVNGKVRVWYRGAPHAACSFKTVNGLVEVFFPPGLAADMQFKTLNGGVYTDFPVTYLPRAAGTAERRDGRFVYRASRATSVRAGAGGPELKFETLNGDIQVRSREQ
jgi:hypothetical protein